MSFRLSGGRRRDPIAWEHELRADLYDAEQDAIAHRVIADTLTAMLASTHDILSATARDIVNRHIAGHRSEAEVAGRRSNKARQRLEAHLTRTRRQN